MRTLPIDGAARRTSNSAFLVRKGSAFPSHRGPERLRPAVRSGKGKSKARALGFATGAIAAAAVLLGAPQSATTAPAPGVTLRVMSFNIFYGGDELNLQTRQFCKDPAGCPETLDQVANAIRASGADVVGLQEATMNTCPLALKLGWRCSERTHVISRYPIVDPPGARGLYVFVEPRPGRVVAVSGVHLPADPYGPYEIRDGATLDDVLQLENDLRMPAIQQQVRELPKLAARGIPVFLSGDFNTPSHLDWTQAVANARADVPFPVEWPVSKALAGAGFKDSFRVVHPNPLAKPGHTWTPGSPEGEKVEVHDRIDWVLSTGPATATASRVVGEPRNPNSDIQIGPWPSDHRGVVSTFDVTPAAMPLLVAVESRSLEHGDTLNVRFHGTGRTGERVAIVRAGGAPGTAVTSKSTAGATDGTLIFATSALAPAAYEAVLINPSGQAVARSPFWLYAHGAVATVSTSKSVYKVGEPITVSWTKAPGMKFDWLGIFTAGDNAGNPHATTCSAGTCGNGHYLIYEYTNAAIEGSTTFGPASQVGYKTWPLGPGTYEIRLLLDDGYRSAASSPRFKIVQP
jgi:endonuclease/exonuclease/phosphatase family metal-dependent hydrolase